MSNAVTPNRRSVLTLNPPQRVCVQDALHIRRDAKDIGQGRSPGATKPSNVWKVGGGDALILKPIMAELARYRNEEDEPQVMRARDFNQAQYLESLNLHRTPDEITGHGANTNLLSAGIPAFEKQPPANADWSTMTLADSVLALPAPPDDPNQTYPLDRILSGKVSYPENTPFLINFLAASSLAGSDTFARFYFGGPAPVAPQDAEGGKYCVALRGSGTAILYEYQHEQPEVLALGSPWIERHRFQAGDMFKESEANALSLMIIPYAKDRIWFVGGTMIFETGGFTLEGLLATIAAAAARRKLGTDVVRNLYKDRPEVTKHKKLRTSTGPGSVDLDFIRTKSAPIVIIRGTYELEGSICDGPFSIPPTTPEGSALTLRIDSYTIPNSGVSGAIYDATTDTVCDTDDDGNFLTGTSRKYYAKLALTSADGIQTPVIWGYNVEMEAQWVDNGATPTSTSLWGVNLNGPGLEPSTEYGYVHVKDLRNALTVLRTYDDIYSRVSVLNATTGAVVSHLMECVTLNARGKKMGKPFHTLTDPNWRDYEPLQLAPLFSRLARKFYRGNSPRDFRLDPEAPVNPETLEREELPWFVYKALIRVLMDAGAPEDEIDVPASSLRFWAAADARDLLLAYGSDLAQVAVDFCSNYLGRVLVRDPNAGSRGMWRSIRAPQPPFAVDEANVLASFKLERPPGSGGLAPMYSGVFGANVAMFVEHSFNHYKKAPETNHITVRGAGTTEDGTGIIEQVATNSADILRRGILPFAHGPDMGLTSIEAVDWQIRKIIERAGVDEEWWEGQAELLLVRDPLDSLQNVNLLRPLRVYDFALVDHPDRGHDRLGLVRTASPGWDQTDRIQLSHYEGVYLT